MLTLPFSDVAAVLASLAQCRNGITLRARPRLVRTSSTLGTRRMFDRSTTVGKDLYAPVNCVSWPQSYGDVEDLLYDTMRVLIHGIC